MIFFGIYSLFLQTVAERCGTDTSDRSNNMTLWVSFMFKDKYLTMYILSVLELLSIKELYWTYRQYLTTHSMSTYYNTYSYTHEQVTTCIRVVFLLLFYTLTFFLFTLLEKGRSSANQTRHANGVFCTSRYTLFKNGNCHLIAKLS